MSIPVLLVVLALIVAIIDYAGDHDVLWLAVVLICAALLWGYLA